MVTWLTKTCRSVDEQVSPRIQPAYFDCVYLKSIAEKTVISTQFRFLKSECKIVPEHAMEA